MKVASTMIIQPLKLGLLHECCSTLLLLCWLLNRSTGRHMLHPRCVNRLSFLLADKPPSIMSPHPPSSAVFLNKGLKTLVPNWYLLPAVAYIVCLRPYSSYFNSRFVRSGCTECRLFDSMIAMEIAMEITESLRRDGAVINTHVAAAAEL